ncbi:PREDICTED: WUSCHEL-related homeobox 12-like [Camelina sativa]|uniref:WUSCHEL-related homeobox 12-like n=1 Tax=Camelina sativa TaxID=90675 RepID=A0ABM0XYB0_CAMSA|nr:PREDICTED: WUSCHEL-related homeobox 12-like [Camelina sativa]
MDQEGASQSPSTSTEPVRSRWSPKPEQILILESIFNSGIVNPPKDETVRIRKMLEKFGAVGDANVFYWFQNRRSRSRRRQRQLQAATAAPATSGGAEDHQHMTAMTMHQYPYSNSEIDLGFGSCSNSSSANYFLNGTSSSQVSSFLLGLSSSSGGCESNGMEDLFTMYGHQSDHHHQHSSNAHSMFSPSDGNSNFQYQQGLMTVFINGVPTEVTKGTIDMKATFGEDSVLLHSSGLPLPTDEFGFLMHSLQHGQAYFLVPRQT